MFVSRSCTIPLSLLIAGTAVVATPVFVQSVALAAPVHHAQADAERHAEAADHDDGHHDDGDKKRAVTVGTLMLAIVVCTGLMLMLAIVLWGHRVRHVARTPLPNQSRGDGLWYLRPPKGGLDRSNQNDTGGDSKTADTP